MKRYKFWSKYQKKVPIRADRNYMKEWDKIGWVVWIFQWMVVAFYFALKSPYLLLLQWACILTYTYLWFWKNSSNAT